MNNDKETAIELSGISKAFNGNPALSDVSLTLRRGNIHCIVGENGAGKSTLIKILTGAYIPDSGTVSFNGKGRSRLSPREAAEAGIVAVYQENVLASQLSVACNIFAGREPVNKWGLVSYRLLKENTEALAAKYGIHIPVDAAVSSLTPAQKQFVKILKSVSINPRVLILDEPTAMLNLEDNEKVLELTRIFSGEGACVIYISHQLGEVLAIADEVTVLRDGRIISTRSNEKKNITPQELTQDMVGRPMELLYERKRSGADFMPSDSGEPLFRVENLRIGGFSAENSFTADRGKITGITGMVGSGRTELLEGIFGYRKKTGGSLYFKGERIKIVRPADAIKKSIGFITEDRQFSGLALPLSIAQNITCTALNLFSGFTVFPRQEQAITQKAAADTRVKCVTVKQPVQELSGGNQQKVILSRWLLKSFDLILLDEPTKGVDINAKFEIYGLLEEMVSQGKSIIMVSSDMSEVISICDRVLIMRNGKITNELCRDSNDENLRITETNIINCALGV
ncbi:MAG: sugar ABC transporter ATP-binding protein [Treponema sp.]|jgi:ABC-type sugar transport system ATPase subunit|nr:sugar ABC transporter ATP-binding protein [Treponema sp.]